MDIEPTKQNLTEVFGNKQYYIDFYQRHYKWDKDPVKKLLDDIFFKFNIEHEKHKNNDKSLEEIIEIYSWYYLNTYVTNKVAGRHYIVDGQQRLTTLTLILISLYHLACHFENEDKKYTLRSLINFQGRTNKFILNHEKEENILHKLFSSNSNQNIKPNTITGENIRGNFGIVKEYLETELKSDEKKFKTFIEYYLQRIVLINLQAAQTDIPMLFEVINDRGVGLKPHEILKGKLLGKLKKEEVEKKYNPLWEEKLEKIRHLASRKINGIDSFFEYYLRSQFADSRADAEKITAADYHRKSFELDKIKNRLQLENESKIIIFLEKNFEYYSNLYIKIWNYRKKLASDFKSVYFNGLTEMDSQFLLILSSCEINDPEEDNKIKKVSYHVDRMYSLLQLFQSYSSNQFTISVYEISKNIRGKNVGEIKAVFDKEILKLISEKQSRNLTDIFNERIFKFTGIDISNGFKHYFFSRIEMFLKKEIDESEMSQDELDLLMKTRKAKNNYTVEHILSWNEENIKSFEDDEEEFNTERNKLGALLLLRGRDNASSNNEVYKNKLKTYAGSLLWNQTLTEAFYKSNKNFETLRKNYNLDFKSLAVFTKEQVEHRQKLLFQIIKIIWK